MTTVIPSPPPSAAETELPRTIPPRSEWARLRPKLEPGEKAFACLLDDLLPEGWTVAVQARFGNMRPDVVAFHPKLGVAIYEVKDWEPGARELWYADGCLWSKDGATKYIAKNPVGQVDGYRERIKELFGRESDSAKVLTTGVVMTNFPDGGRAYVASPPPKDLRQAA